LIQIQDAITAHNASSELVRLKIDTGEATPTHKTLPCNSDSAQVVVKVAQIRLVVRRIGGNATYARKVGICHRAVGAAGIIAIGSVRDSLISIFKHTLLSLSNTALALMAVTTVHFALNIAVRIVLCRVSGSARGTATLGVGSTLAFAFIVHVLVVVCFSTTGLVLLATSTPFASASSRAPFAFIVHVLIVVL